MKSTRVLLFVGLSVVMTAVSCRDDRSEPDKVQLPGLNIQDSVLVLSEGGTATVQYSVDNPVEGGIVTAASECGWISGIDCDVEGTVSFEVEANTVDEYRTGALNVIYFYGQGDTVSRNVRVVQEPLAVAYDYEIADGYFYGEYRGIVPGYEAYSFVIQISDKPFEGGKTGPGAFMYIFGAYSEEPLDPEDPRPADGEYVFELDGGMAPYPFMFAGNISWWYHKDSDGFPDIFGDYEEGTLTVTTQGDKTVYEAKIIDANGISHHVTSVSSEPFVISVSE